jgi:hypothetical protein
MISIHWAQFKRWSVSLGAGIESGVACWDQLGRKLNFGTPVNENRSTFQNFGFEKPNMLDSTTNNSYV